MSRRFHTEEKHIENTLPEMPFYVIEYIRAKKRSRLSPATLSGYLHDYTKFFDWLRMEGLTSAQSNRDIPLSVLESLRKKDVEFFIEMLMEEKIEKRNGIYEERSDASINRFIQSLKSLFNYLTVESENDEGECYFYRNVMAKIRTLRKNESAAYRANRISQRILDKHEMEEFIYFLKNSYEQTLTSYQRARFEKNKIRDIAIVSLLQGSGIRVNELANLQLTDIDARQCAITVRRKGNKADAVGITPSAMEDLMTYLDRRQDLYKPESTNLFVFLSTYRRVANPISTDAIRALIEKYTKVFLSGKSLTPHILRHSFSKKWLDEGGSLVGLRDQLGHNSIETTSLYTNMSLDEHKEFLKKMDGTPTTPNTE